MERNQETSGDKTTTESPMRYKKGGISKYDAEKRGIKHDDRHVIDHANKPSTKTKDHRKQDTLDKRTYKTNDKPDSSDARKHHSRSKDPEKQDLPDMRVNRFNGRNHVSTSTFLVVSALIFDSIIVFGVLSIVYLTHLSTLKIPDRYMLVQKHVTNTTNQTIEQTSLMTSLTTEAASSTISSVTDKTLHATEQTNIVTTSSLTTEAASSTISSVTDTTLLTTSSSAQETTTKIPDCPDNWITYGQSCYLFSNESLIWSDARIRCENLNGYLVEITSADEDQFLVKHANFSTSQINEEECFTTRGYEYSGFKSTTANGITCQRWDSQTPHRHTNTDVNKYPENSLADAANYCRDPDRTGKPWCYTVMSSTRWQLCGINRCEKENYWAGMMVIDGLWKWVSTHNTLDQGYTNWGSSLVLGTCGSLVKEINFQWRKGNCNHRTLFICEKDTTLQTTEKSSIMTTSSLTTDAASSTTSTTSSTPPSSSSSAQATTTRIPDCPDNWITYGQSCYLFSNESLIWSDARIRCENLNGYLVEITSADEDQFLVKHANFSTSQINEEECFTTRGYEYSGFKSTTANGITCQRWDSQTPHRHTNTDVNKYPENSLADAANYCRDPDRTGKPWCYTVMSSTRWQLCGINRCEKENYWAGMMVIDGLWKWVSTHNTLDQGYTNWGSSLVLGTCGSLVKEINFQWRKGNCNHRTLFICEKGKF